MALSSFSFILFLLASVIAVRLCPKRLRRTILLLAGFGYALTFGPWALVSAAGTGLFAWLAGRVTDKREGNARRNAAFAGVGIIAAWLVAAKTLFRDAALTGASYYALSSIAYLLDIKRKKIRSEKDPLFVIGYLTSFLTLNQGPFVRRSDFGAEYLEPRTVGARDLKRGALRMLWGFLKKIVIADGMSKFVGIAFSGSNVFAPCVWLGVFLYTIEIYMDFSGYMDIIAGAGCALGVTVPENFDDPLFSASVAEFWRRWHITLGAWFKDYVFFPISVSKPMTRLARKLREKKHKALAKRLTAIIPLFFVWVLTGLWHGTGMNYLVWGLLNGLCIALSTCLEGRYAVWKNKLGIRGGKAWHAFSVIRTFVLLTLIRVFSRAGSVSSALNVFKGMATAGRRIGGAAALFVGLQPAETTWLLIACFLSVIVLLLERLAGIRKLLDWYCARCRFVRCLIAVVLFFIVLVCHGDTVTGQFIYAQF